MAEVKPDIETFAKIKVIGVGGSGGSSVDRMIASKIRGVEFVAMNTDVQALHKSQATLKVHLGKTVTRGLGAGMNPEVGQRAAEESADEIRELLKGTDMVFVTCGLGGGTGTGAGPVVAAIAKEVGALTVAVVTKPFAFEGAQRRAIADQGFEKLVGQVDAIITIPNDRILQIIDRKTTLVEAFETVDDVLRQGVQGISEAITVPGLINVDFADVRTVMAGRGSALMGIGRGHGDNRAIDAAKAAVASPLLEVSMDGAKAVLFIVTGGSNLAMQDVTEAAKIIGQAADPNVAMIWGTILDESMKDEIKITVIATGFEKNSPSSAKPAKVNFAPAQNQVSSAPRQAPVPQQAPARSFANDAPPSEPLNRMPIQNPRPAANQQAGGFFSNMMHSFGNQPGEEEVAPEAAAAEQAKPAPSQPAPAAQQPHVSQPVYAPMNQRPVQAPQPAPAPKKAASEDDELEIPAFIRKKMM
ncbi:cell division protein FtsZ [Candidatus Uhrbacteria bacterium]|nr:cell division protein FtsZ [Candidatus Uhrbacteria bacterium]